MLKKTCHHPYIVHYYPQFILHILKLVSSSLLGPRHITMSNKNTSTKSHESKFEIISLCSMFNSIIIFQCKKYNVTYTSQQCLSLGASCLCLPSLTWTSPMPLILEVMVSCTSTYPFKFSPPPSRPKPEAWSSPCHLSPIVTILNGLKKHAKVRINSVITSKKPITLC